MVSYLLEKNYVLFIEIQISSKIYCYPRSFADMLQFHAVLNQIWFEHDTVVALTEKSTKVKLFIDSTASCISAASVLCFESSLTNISKYIKEYKRIYLN